MVGHALSQQRTHARATSLKWTNYITDSLGKVANLSLGPPQCVAPFNRNEVILGKHVCSDANFEIFQIKSFRLVSDVSQNFTQDEKMKRERMASETLMSEEKYVMKRLKRGLERNPDFQDDVSEIAVEASLLSLLDHPSIIKIHGISASKHDAFLEGSDGFFLILEHIEETLDEKIEISSEKAKKTKKVSGMKKWFARKSIPNMHVIKNPITDEQLQVSFSLASAIDYLHRNEIIFRDLKPANVGFDTHGRVKLFNFCFAKVMNCETMESEGVQMNGAGASKYYLSPEVLACKPCDLKTDVYSFACIMWAILESDHPYSAYSNREKFLEAVVIHGKRPKINTRWPRPICDALQKSFSANPIERPEMSDIVRVLEQCDASK